MDAGDTGEMPQIQSEQIQSEQTQSEQDQFQRTQDQPTQEQEPTEPPVELGRPTVAAALPEADSTTESPSPAIMPAAQPAPAEWRETVAVPESPHVGSGGPAAAATVEPIRVSAVPPPEPAPHPESVTRFGQAKQAKQEPDQIRHDREVRYGREAQRGPEVQGGRLTQQQGQAQPSAGGSSATGRATSSHQNVWQAAPAATVASFARMTGVDLGFVPVVRMPEVGATAARLDARAYTHAGVVHLPESAGPLDSAANESLIAHELTHVAQQRALGPRATEGEPLGDALEAQARAVERAHLGEQVAPEELDWPDGAQPPSGGLSWTLEGGFQMGAPQQDGNFPDAAQGIPGYGFPGAEFPGAEFPGAEFPGSGFPGAEFPGADRPQRAATNPPLPPTFGPYPGQWDDSIQPLRFPEEIVIEDGVAAPEQQSSLAQEHILSAAEVMRVAEVVRSGLVMPSVDPRDPKLLDELATGLYDRLRTSLRGELISDRERAGMLTEFH